MLHTVIMEGTARTILYEQLRWNHL